MRIEYFGTAEAARAIGMSRRTIEGWRTERGMERQRRGPPWFRLPGGRVAYPRDALWAWLAAERERQVAELRAFDPAEGNPP